MKCCKFEEHLVALYNKLIRATSWPAPWPSHQLTGHSIEKTDCCNRPRRDEVVCFTTTSRQPPCSDVNPLDSMNALAQYCFGSNSSTSSLFSSSTVPKKLCNFLRPWRWRIPVPDWTPLPLVLRCTDWFSFCFRQRRWWRLLLTPFEW